MDSFALTNPFPWLAIVALCLALGSVFASRSAFYRERLAEESVSRYGTVDGLRGFLALAVFGSHAVNMYFLHAAGRWVQEGPSFYGAAAEAGVSLFFMITAFLFWSRVLKSGGRFDAASFLRGRVRRITPMYLFSVLIAVLVVLATSHRFLPEGPFAFLKELRPWLAFGFMDYGALNGVEHARAVNAVYWTLAYEWMFYLVLPLAALYVGGWRAVAFAAVVCFFGKQSPIVLNFVFGAIGAEAIHRGWLRGRLASPYLAAIPLATLALVTLGGFETIYAILPEALLFLVFLFVLDGNTLFGLLRTAAARFLGLISYSVYLTHCIVLYVLVHATQAHIGLQNLSATQYWTIAALAAAGCVAFSAATYRAIEYPFIRRRVILPAHARPASGVTTPAQNPLTTLPSGPSLPTS